MGEHAGFGVCGCKSTVNDHIEQDCGVRLSSDIPDRTESYESWVADA